MSSRTEFGVSVACYGLKIAFEKLVRRAEKAGIAVVVDADLIAIRIMPRGEEQSGKDLRTLGDIVRLHNACGTGSASYSGDACNNAPVGK